MFQHIATDKPEKRPGKLLDLRYVGLHTLDALYTEHAASQTRLNQALQTLLSIRAGGGPIDPEVFEKAANDWDEYIRG